MGALTRNAPCPAADAKRFLFFFGYQKNWNAPCPDVFAQCCPQNRRFFFWIPHLD